ncbi:MAG: nitrilase-related carbon-nitrogen hydrolase, partial [Longimicrobiales bacterium]|nr:nitrilase-related carbon-nitrogen hydrolase [Longimicrobiales bacterium]
MSEFHSIYSHGYVRAAACVPRIRLSDPATNLEHTLELARQAHDRNAALAVFPELGLTGYSNDDLFQQDALLDAGVEAVGGVVEASADLMPVLMVGAPLRFEGKLFNCAVVIHRGRVLGLVPKTYIPNYREYYEKRQFTSGRDAV